MKLLRNVSLILFSVLVLAGGLYLWLLSPAKSELRAYTSMNNFLASNHITNVVRKSCAYDSDNDGYGTCMVVTETDQISLQCPAGFVNTLPVIGATSCKEMPSQILKLGTTKGK